ERIRSTTARAAKSTTLYEMVTNGSERPSDRRRNAGDVSSGSFFDRSALCWPHGEERPKAASRTMRPPILRDGRFAAKFTQAALATARPPQDEAECFSLLLVPIHLRVAAAAPCVSPKTRHVQCRACRAYRYGNF